MLSYTTDFEWKKIRKIWMILEIADSFWKSDLCLFHLLGQKYFDSAQICLTPLNIFWMRSNIFDHAQIFKFIRYTLTFEHGQNKFDCDQKILNTVKKFWTQLKYFWTSRWNRHWHLLTNCHSLFSQQTIIYSEYVDFYQKILLFRNQHQRNSITKLMQVEKPTYLHVLHTMKRNYA